MNLLFHNLEYESTRPIKSLTGSILNRDELATALDGVTTVIHILDVKDFAIIPDEKRMWDVNVTGEPTNS